MNAKKFFASSDEGRNKADDLQVLVCLFFGAKFWRQLLKKQIFHPVTQELIDTKTKGHSLEFS